MAKKRAKSADYAVIIPACDEQESISKVIAKLQDFRDVLVRDKLSELVIAVGANGCRDHTAEVAENAGVIVGQSEKKGYGHGCTAAISALRSADCDVKRGYWFFAADGANCVEDLARGIRLQIASGASLVLGNRTNLVQNWRVVGLERILPNLTLGCFASLLSRHFFIDLAPLRFIAKDLFDKLSMSELTWGWTIEAQILTSLAREKIEFFKAKELPRIAGEQKVSGVSWRLSTKIGIEIIRAALRSRSRWRQELWQNF